MIADTVSAIFDQWEMWMIAEGIASRTIRERIMTIRALANWAGRDPLEIDADDVVAYLSREELSRNSRSTYHSKLKVFYSWAQARGFIEENPVAQVRAAKRSKAEPRPVSAAQFARAVDAARAAGDTTMEAMLLLAGLAGFRVHEIARVRGDHIDIDAQTLMVRGKGDKMVNLPAHPEILAVAAKMPYPGHWFPSQRQGREHIGGRTVTERIRLHLLSCRINATAHCLRHHFGTQLVETGADLRVVQELMRHDSLATTAIYTAVADSRKRAAIVRLTVPTEPPTTPLLGVVA